MVTLQMEGQTSQETPLLRISDRVSQQRPGWPHLPGSGRTGVTRSNSANPLPFVRGFLQSLPRCAHFLLLSATSVLTWDSSTCCCHTFCFAMPGTLVSCAKHMLCLPFHPSTSCLLHACLYADQTTFLALPRAQGAQADTPECSPGPWG